MATGTGLEGEQIDANIRVEMQASNSPEAALTTWSATDEQDFEFLLGGRLAYDIDPCTSGEHRTTLGSHQGYAQHPSNVVLPDTITGQRGEIDGLRGRRAQSVTLGVVAGQMRVAIMTGGTHTPDAPSLIGATTLWESTTTGTGEVTLTLPTGADTIRFPLSGGLWVVFKGTGATGRGEIGPGPAFATGAVDMPSSWIRRDDAAGLRGQNPGERDIGLTAGGYGDDEVAYEDPVSDPDTTEYGPDNHPFLRLVAYQAALGVG
jgi:hypothetical protein